MSNHTGAADQPTDPAKLRFQFVELLFALATAEVAVQFGNLAAAHLHVMDAPAAYSHLTFALILIATSWVGWSRSIAAGNRLPLENVFTLAFVVLLLDVALVVFYFIIVRGVEPAMKSTQGNAGHETFWVTAIFAVYVAWDFVTKAMARDPRGEALNFWGRVAGPFWTRANISIYCAVLALAVWYFLKDVTTVSAVLATDLGLVALDLFFRSRKQDGARRWSRWSKITVAVGVLAFAGAFYWR